MKRWSRIRKTLLLMCVLLIAFPMLTFAENAVNYKDTPTDLLVRAERKVISGQHMVLDGLDKQGQKQLFYKNLQTGQEKQITNNSLEKILQQIAENANGQAVIVWGERDKQSKLMDVYSVNLFTGVTKKLNQQAGGFYSLQTDGDYAIFSDSNDQNSPFYVVNINDGTETQLDRKTYNSITFLYNGKAVFERFADNSVNLLDLATGTTKMIYKGDLFPGGRGFNGKYYFMFASNKQSKYKHIILSVETGQIKEVEEEWDVPHSFGQTTIGDHYAAFLTKNDSGEVIINWVDLATGQLQEMKSPTTRYSYFMFNGDQLLMNDAVKRNNKLFYRTLNGTEDKFGAMLPKPQPVFKSETVSKTIGTKGGTLTPTSGKAVLTVAKGSFSIDAKVSLTSSQVAASKATLVSTTWVVAAGQKWKTGVTLTLSYDPSLAGSKKLVMAKYDAKSVSWKPISSKADAKKNTFSAVIQEVGTYAVIVK